MPTSLQTLILLLSSLSLLLTSVAAQRRPPRRTSFAYNFNGTKPTALTYQGDAHFPSETTFLRLTRTDAFGNAQPNSVGRVLYSNPVTFWRRRRTQASFQTNIKFIISPNRGDFNPPADGLVFFITAVNSTVGAAGGSFGAFDASGKNPSVFSVEFDVFPNVEFDPRFRHVGIDIGSQISSNVTAVDDGVVGQEVAARIDYNADTDVISVNGSAGGKTFEVRYLYDLRNILPQQVQVGISAATGGLVAVHDVISWSFSSSMRRRRANSEKIGDHI